MAVTRALSWNTRGQTQTEKKKTERSGIVSAGPRCRSQVKAKMEAAPGICHYQLTGKKENLEHSIPWPSLSHLRHLRVGDPTILSQCDGNTPRMRGLGAADCAQRKRMGRVSGGVVAGPALLPVTQRRLLTAPPQGRPHPPLGAIPGACYSAQGSERETAFATKRDGRPPRPGPMGPQRFLPAGAQGLASA